MNSTLKALDIMGADKGGSGGVIVNISSLLALNLTSHLPVYAATKAAVLQFSIRMGVSIICIYIVLCVSWIFVRY